MSFESQSDHEQSEKRFNIALNALKTSSNDTQKFASLCVLATIKPHQLNEHQFEQIFNSIDHQFLYRLLISSEETNDVPEGCSPFVYQSISLSIISSFYSIIPQRIDSFTSIKLLKAMTLIMDKLKNKNTFEDTEIQIINDIILCFDSFFTFINDIKVDDELMMSLFETKFTHLLIQLNSKESLDSKKIDLLLCKIASNYKWAAFEPHSFDEFMILKANDFKSKQNEDKFILCQQLNTFLNHNSMYFQKLEFPQWTKVLNEALFEIFKSKLNKPLRDPTFKLTASLTESFGGFKWMSDNVWDEKSAKFFMLIIRLCCIEIYINFDSQQIDMEVIASCFILLEHSIITLTKDEEESNLTTRISSDEMFNMLTAIKDTMRVIMEYLQTCSLQWEEMHSKSSIYLSVLASIRLLSVWMTEETEAFRKEIAAILPFILKVFREMDETQAFSMYDVFIPAVYSLIDDENMKRIMMQENILEIIRRCDTHKIDLKYNDLLEEINECLK